MTTVPHADPHRDEHGLDETKKRLEGIVDRPFDVDATLAQHRARKEREMDVRRRAEATLEETRKVAREKRHELQDAEAQKRTQEMLEKDLEFQEKRLKFAGKMPPPKKAGDHDDRVASSRLPKS